MTTTSRRSLLRAGTFGAILATLVPAQDAAAAKTTDLYSRSRFKHLVDATFTLSSATATWSVALVSITDLPGARPGADNAYGLTFRSSEAGPPQGTYTLARSRFTQTTLFVVPSDANRLYLQVVVNCTS